MKFQFVRSSSSICQREKRASFQISAKQISGNKKSKITTDFKAVCNTKYKLSSYIDYLCIQHNNVEENL